MSTRRTHPTAPRPRLIRRESPIGSELVWDDAARRVVEHDNGPLRVIGGPGTGKTTLLLAAIARRVREGVDPGRILLLVGSRRAANELRERLVRMIGMPTRGIRTMREPLVRTVHSYAFGVLRLQAARNGDPPPRLLSSPEQDALVRDMLAGEPAGEVPDSGWPERIRPAIGLPSFAAELRELLLRAAERGLGPDELIDLGKRYEVPEWEAAGRFFQRYEQVIALRSATGRGAVQAAAALDAAELVAAALDALASDPELLAGERERVRYLFVDDAQDLDPQQMELVRVLGSTAHTVLLAGDPDQAVFSFRGADPEGLRALDADTAVLTVDHRSRPLVRAATARIAERLPGAGMGRKRTGATDTEPPGQVQVRIFRTAAQEANWIADQLRRAHLIDGVPWAQMAVVSRSTRRTLPALRRALLAAGVPISTPPDQVPLGRNPAVVPLLLILRCAARPETIDAETATALLSSPLGAADPMRMRRLRRGLLRLEAAGRPDSDVDAAAEPDVADETTSSDRLIVELLQAAVSGEPDPLTALQPDESEPLRRICRLLAIAGAAIRDGENAEQVLWRVWQASGLESVWTEVSARGGPAGLAADRDLDAVLALFDAAARYTDRLPGSDVAGFADYLSDQQIPADSLAPQALRDDGVALLTVHAARGREWRVVAVPGVQEGVWPNLRLRDGLLGGQRLVDLLAGVAEPDSRVVSRFAPLLAEERRLFYVACSRARETLLVSAVQHDEEQPSRFLDELDPVAGERVPHRPGRALALAELVGELRRAVTEPVPADDDGTRAARRCRAAVQLARLAEAGVPGAHPDDWYGVAPVSSNEPLHGPGEVVPVSPSDVERIHRCPLRWMLERHGGTAPSPLTVVTGSLVHALVQAAAAGASPADLDEALRTAWKRLDAGAPWFSRQELARVRAMLQAFADWERRTRAEGLRLVAVEQPLQLDLPPTPGPDGRSGSQGPVLRLRGRVDRLEVDRAGRPVVVDIKTGRTAVSRRQAEQHPQLALYQLAVALGAFTEVLDEPREPGGARLVYLADRTSSGEAKEPVQPPLGSAELAQWREVVQTCAEHITSARFLARTGPDCDRCSVRTSCPANASGRAVTTE